ncbi:MAG: iron-sulfur cluster assembly protein [Nitrososphaerales archaeon]
MENDLEKRVSEHLKNLVDEETTRKFGELNIVADVSEVSPGSVRVKFQPLSAYSPFAVDTGRDIRDTVLAVEGVKTVRVECVGHMMDELVDRIVNRDEIKPKVKK